MMLRRRLGSWKMHLFLLVTCVLLITDAAPGSEMAEAEEVEENGSGGEEEEIAGGSVAAEARGGGGGGGDAEVGGGGGGSGGGVVVVENGTADAVVLDCPFHLDKKDQTGMHINWYHPKISSPVYVWIPEREPTALWFLRDRVDLTYEASPDTYHRHRALRILEPTTDVAGRYSCRVSTFTVELVYTQELIVFSEPSEVQVWVEERDEGQVAVICKVEEVYPQPVIYLYKKSPVKEREALSGGTPVISSSHGTYNMQVEKAVQEDTLDGPTEFECYATIPNTEVQFVTSTKYQPRVSVTTGAVIGGSSTPPRALAALFLLSLFLLYV